MSSPDERYRHASDFKMYSLMYSVYILHYILGIDQWRSVHNECLLNMIPQYEQRGICIALAMEG